MSAKQWWDSITKGASPNKEELIRLFHDDMHPGFGSEIVKCVLMRDRVYPATFRKVEPVLLAFGNDEHVQSRLFTEMYRTGFMYNYLGTVGRIHAEGLLSDCGDGIYVWRIGSTGELSISYTRGGNCHHSLIPSHNNRWGADGEFTSLVEVVKHLSEPNNPMMPLYGGRV